MTVESFIIKIQQTGAEAAARSIQGIESSAHKTASALAFFRQALVALSAVRVVETFTDFADSATRIDNRLRVATKSSEDFARAQKFVYQISRDTRTEVEANAVTYSRLLRSTEGLGLKTTELEKAMEGLSYAVKVGGATSQEARNSLIQFSQSLASGALRGDELRSVAEQLPALADAIGKEFGVAGGQLLAFAKANPGILETDRVLRGVIRASDELKRQAAGMTLTISESFVVLSNSVKQFINQANSAYGILGIISQAVLFLADNLNFVIIALVSFGAAMLAVNLGLFINQVAMANNWIIRLVMQLRIVTAAQVLWNAAMAANPIGLIVVAVGAFVAALVAAYQYIPGVATVLNGLWAVFVAGVQVVAQVAATLAGPLMSAWNLMITAVQPLIAVLQAVWQAIWAVLQPLVALVAPMLTVSNASDLWRMALNAALVPLKLIAELLPYIVTAALTPFVMGLQAAVNGLNALGVVSDSTTKSVNKAAGAFYEEAQKVFSLEKGLKTLSNVTNLMAGKQNELAVETDKATSAMVRQKKTVDALSTGHGKTMSKMDAVNAKYEALHGKSENLTGSTKRLSSSTSSLTSALTMATPKVEEMAMGTEALNQTMGSGTSTANQYAAALQQVAASGSMASSSISSFMKSSMTSKTPRTGMTVINQPSEFANQLKDMGGSFLTRRGSGAVEAKNVVDSRTGNKFSGTATTEWALSMQFEAWLKQQDKIVANMQKASDNLKNNTGNSSTVPQGSLGGGAMGMNTAALDRNTKALTSSSQDYMDLVDKLYNKLDLARKNVSGGYTGSSSLANSSIAGISKLPGFASGVEGVFTGAGGTDNNLFMARVSKGEGVKITPKSEMRKGGGGSTINVTINATDAGSIVRNEAQVRKVMARAVASAQRAGRA